MGKILFASPFILETKKPDQFEAPAHRMAQEYINSLRGAGHEVILIDDQDSFSDKYCQNPDTNLIVAMSFDGNWLVGAVEAAKPAIAVHCFSDIPGKHSTYIIQLSQLSKPEALVNYVKLVLG